MLVAAAMTAQAKQITSGADFLKIDAGARGSALGQSYTALASDANALAWNPAGLGFLNQPELSYLRIQYLADTAYNYGAFALPLRAGSGKLGLGLGVIQLGSPAFDSTLGVAPAASFSDMALFLGAAYGTGKVSFGATGKYLIRDVGGFEGKGLSFDAGIMVRPAKAWSLGLVGCHLGPPVKFDASSEKLPSLLRLGIAWTVFENIGHAVRFTTDQTCQFSSMTYRAGGGIEYVYNQLFFLRGGFAGDHDRRDPTAGAGLDLDVFRLDYAYLPYGKLGDTHRVSALFRFGKPDDPKRGLRPPLHLTADAYDKSVLLNWDPARTADVTGTHLYIRKPGQKDYRRITSAPLTVTAVKLRGLKNGAVYEVGATSVTDAGRESRMVRLPISPDPSRSQEHLELVPINLRSELKDEGLVLLWETSVGAAGYHLYLLDEKGAVVRKLTQVPLKEAQVTLRKLSPDRSYRFHVTAVAKDGTESRASVPVEARLTSATVAAPSPTPVPTAPSTGELLPPIPLRIQAGKGSADLSWDLVPGAAGYHVYVSTDGGQTFRRITSQPTSTPKVKLQPLKPRTYLFAVTSISSDGKESQKAIAQPVTPE